MDFKGDLNSDGKQMSSKGSIKATKLKASAAGSASTVPVDIEYSTVYTLETQAGVLSQAEVKIGKAVQHLTGSYNAATTPAKINMKVNAPEMPLDDLEGFLPAVGVVLPSGSKLSGRNAERQSHHHWSHGQTNAYRACQHLEHETGWV